MELFDYGPGRYTDAAICARGHVLTADAEGYPVARFCSKCGAVILSKCSACGVEIRGHYIPPGVTAVGGPLAPPAFCFSCGKPFPWTIEKLSAAKDLADELDDISAEDRAKLKTAIDDVAAGGPRAEAGAARIALRICGYGVGSDVRRVSVCGETVRTSSAETVPMN
jgi:hypothetical protein